MGGSVGAEANNAALVFEGASGSRDLATQSGQSVALLMEALSLEGGVYTLIFDVIDPGVPYECIARVTSSDAGNTVERLFHVIKGCSISLSGRVYGITITDTTPADLPLISGEPVSTPGAGSAYTVTCIIERGTRGINSAGPTLYSGSAAIASHASLVLDIPTNSGVNSLEVSSQVATTFPTSNPNVTVTFTTAAGGIFKQYNPILQPGFVAIPPGATQVKITNNDGTNGINSSVTWGIDG